MTQYINNPLLPGGGIHHVAVRTTNLPASLRHQGASGELIELYGSQKEGE